MTCEYASLIQHVKEIVGRVRRKHAQMRHHIVHQIYVYVCTMSTHRDQNRMSNFACLHNVPRCCHAAGSSFVPSASQYVRRSPAGATPPDDIMLQASKNAYITGGGRPDLIAPNWNKIYDGPNVVAYSDYDPDRPRRLGPANVIVSFRGTANLTDAYSDIKSILSDYNNSPRYNTDRDELDKIMSNFRPIDFNYFFTGHSLGGVSAMHFLRTFMADGTKQPWTWNKDENRIKATVFNSGFQPNKDFDGNELQNTRKIYMVNDPLYNDTSYPFNEVFRPLSNKWGRNFNHDLRVYPNDGTKPKCPYLPPGREKCKVLPPDFSCLAKCGKWEADPIAGHYLGNFDRYIMPR